MGLVGSGLAGGLGLVLGVLLVACGDDGDSSSSSGNSRYRTLCELQVTSNNECYPEDAVSASEIVAPCVQFYECMAQQLDPACLEAYIVQDECLYALSCSDFDAYLGSIGDPYPCQAEEEATDAACGDFMTVLEPAEAACF